jgi:two-component system, chemotaxis family, sensor kinase Cph1
MQPSDTLNITEFTTSETIDLTNCDREPIHIPGLIQPHGVMLTLSEPQLEILQVSENVEQVLGITVVQLLGQPLSQLCSKTKVKEISQYLKYDNLEVFSRLELRIHSVPTSSTNQKAHSQSFRGMLHRSDGVLVMELEPRKVTKSQQILKFYYLLKEAIATLTQS